METNKAIYNKLYEIAKKIFEYENIYGVRLTARDMNERVEKRECKYFNDKEANEEETEIIEIREGAFCCRFPETDIFRILYKFEKLAREKAVFEKEETPDFSNYKLNGKKLDLYQYASKDYLREGLMGVTVGNSHLYVSDAFVLIKIKDNRYNELCGKTISKKGEFINASHPDFESVLELLEPNKVYDFSDSIISTKTHSKLGEYYYKFANIKRIAKLMKMENIKKLYQSVNGILFVVSSNIFACCMCTHDEIGEEFMEYNVPMQEISVPIFEILESEGFEEKETKKDEQKEIQVNAREENEQIEEEEKEETDNNTTDEQIQESAQTDEQTDEICIQSEMQEAENTNENEQTEISNEQFCAAPEYCSDITLSLSQIEFYANSTLDTYTQIDCYGMCENIEHKQERHTHKNISNVYIGTFGYFQVFLGTRKKPPYFSVVKPNARLPNTSIYVYSDLERKHIARTRQRGEYLLNTFPLSLSNGYRMATEG